jgi:O-acetyl-ADP-ribose deacetylase (regulator of RNase III)
MPLTYLRTSIFDSPAQTLVNTVNTVGVMGKGIAREFKTRYPDMYKEYRRLCEQGKLRVGNLHLWRGSTPWVLNFPTKTTWRRPSKLEYLELGLKSFRQNYERMGITSVSFPPLGCGNGNLDWNDVRPLMEVYLRGIPIPIYVHDRQIASGFVPEHEEAAATQPPATFSEFLKDVQERIAASHGSFKTLRDKTPFAVEMLHDNSLQIRRKSGKVERVINHDELSLAWDMLQAGLLTSDQYSDENSRRYKSYIFAILSTLPYVRLAEVQRHRDGSRSSSHGLFVQDASRASMQAASIEPFEPAEGESAQGYLCLFR